MRRLREGLWNGEPAGVRVPEVLRASATGRALAALNQELFRGDLAPCESNSAGVPESDCRYVVDTKIPGHEAIQRYLDRTGKASVAALAIVRVDLGLDADDCIYRIRCPILCRLGIDRVIGALGPDRIVNWVR